MPAFNKHVFSPCYVSGTVLTATSSVFGLVGASAYKKVDAEVDLDISSSCEFIMWSGNLLFWVPPETLKNRAAATRTKKDMVCC